MSALAAFFGAFGVIPGWLWAAALAGVMVSHCGASVDAMDARKDALDAREALQQERKWSDDQLEEARLRADAAEADLRDQLEAQEGKDAQNRQTVAELRDQLQRNARGAGGSGLRDPWAKPASCPAVAAGPAGAGAGGGANDRAEAPGVLSAQLERLLLERLGEADDINVAYASCREQALADRERLRQMQLSHAPAPPTGVVQSPRLD